jgi:signal transduction histidine kinase
MAWRRGDKGIIDETAIASRREGNEPLLFHQQLAGKRLYLNSQVRFLVALGIVAGALFARGALGIDNLDVEKLVVLALLLAVLNIGIFLYSRRHRTIERRIPEYRRLTGLMHLSIAMDFVFLTVAVWLAGGAKSPFVGFYLLHVILAAAFLSPRAACAHALFGYTLLGGLLLGQWRGFIPPHFPVGIVNSSEPLDARYVFAVLGTQGILMGLGIYLVAGLTVLLHRGEQHLRTANRELERFSRTQRDFLHIALHDLKSPVNAATMLMESVRVASVPPLSGQQLDWVDRACRRLKDTAAFLHDFSVLAELDVADIKKQAKEIDTAAMLQGVASENQDIVRERNQQLRVEVAGPLPPLFGLERLLHAAVANLITNASKYTPREGTIVLRAGHADRHVRIEVQDNGIGIAPEDQPRLFQEFVRIKRKDHSLGEVAGSGLGLSIVRRVVEAHGGRVGVTSELNKGSTFFIEFTVPENPSSVG